VQGHAGFELYNGVRVGRRRLDRWWDASLNLNEYGRPEDDRYRPLVVIGANPSDADHEWDDPTIFKCYKYARREPEANGLVMVNIDIRISTDPSKIDDVTLPYGAVERGWEVLDEALCENVVAVVAGWGQLFVKRADFADRVRRVKDIAADVGRVLVCLGANGDGTPKHPLYRPDAMPFSLWWSP